MAQGNLSTGTGFFGACVSIKNSELLPKGIETVVWSRGQQKTRKSCWLCWGQGRGNGEPFHVPETNCKRHRPGQNPGLRKEMRSKGERSVTLTLLHAKKSWTLWSSTATVASASITGGCCGWKRRRHCPAGPCPPCYSWVLCHWYCLN